MGWLGAAAVGSIPALVTFFSFSSLLLLFLSSLSKTYISPLCTKLFLSWRFSAAFLLFLAPVRPGCSLSLSRFFPFFLHLTNPIDRVSPNRCLKASHEAVSFEATEWSERLTSRRVGWLGAAAVGSIPALVIFFSFSFLLLLFLSSLSKTYISPLCTKFPLSFSVFLSISRKRKTHTCTKELSGNIMFSFFLWYSHLWSALTFIICWLVCFFFFAKVICCSCIAVTKPIMQNKYRKTLAARKPRVRPRKARWRFRRRSQNKRKIILSRATQRRWRSCKPKNENRSHHPSDLCRSTCTYRWCRLTFAACMIRPGCMHFEGFGHCSYTTWAFSACF